MSRPSVTSMHASRSTDTALPLRGYLLSVGGTLLCLLWATGLVLPAQVPGSFAEPDLARPAIRVHSYVKAPELVVIDTNQLPPTPADSEVVATASLPDRLDASGAVQETVTAAPIVDGRSHTTTELPSQLRDSFGQSVADQARASPRAVATSKLGPSEARSGTRRSTRHPKSRGRSSLCGWASHDPCNNAFAPTRLW
jgi:hypothetical protein